MADDSEIALNESNLNLGLSRMSQNKLVQTARSSTSSEKLCQGLDASMPSSNASSPHSFLRISSKTSHSTDDKQALTVLSKHQVRLSDLPGSAGDGCYYQVKETILKPTSYWNNRENNLQIY